MRPPPVVLEFVDHIDYVDYVDNETAKKWDHSAQYEAARHVRTGAAELNMMVVEGL
jgi:uncharacterized protein (DUF1330 family)